ncbi:hypothetical protein CkaCkLH20_09796 [Colletotrichum karsti]|uniref:Uncharacterized protein n=1 Tax=Colletotrichum karsti TaxID=1095194 RepID=A0A9P6HYT1_9PEZI|nr:uncharacterized protein CkaCkLH20_09796 [Colletotrichum karsti]KAF9872617.1 hypothetical protein CkaCkLH20_09796 [Colletotrichum karsti]
MEVNMENFWQQLPRILISIAESNFVAIDVEMTGITDNLADVARKQNNHTRQGLYEAGKRIASTYNLFQLGLTCVKSDGDDSYKTETYSFYVSPLLLEDTREDDFFAQDVGRNLTTSLSTLKFMRREGLQLEKILDDPVPYLSRKEVREAEERLERRTQRQPLKDHPYNEDDEGLTFFSAYVFDEITTWLGDRSENKDPEIKIRIPPSESKKRSSVYHKIVRVTARNLAPHMKCRTWDYGATVVIYMDNSDEDCEKEELIRKRFDDSLRKQTGIRLIIEALAGGRFAGIIDPSSIVDALRSWPGGMTVQDFCKEVEDKFGFSAYRKLPRQSEQPSEHGRPPADNNNSGSSDWTPGDDSSKEELLEGSMTPEGLHDGWATTDDEWATSSRRKVTNDWATADDGWVTSSNGWATADNEWARSNNDRNIRSMQSPASLGASWEEPAGYNESDHSVDEESEEALVSMVATALCSLERRLESTRPPIVGHNQLWDLLFLYQTFIDDLPDSSGEFFANIHELFPFILDTKIMAISHQPIEGEDPLADLFNRFTVNNAKPYISWDPSYGYSRKGNVHEAGYDSYMTATVLLRLGHKLARESEAGGADQRETWDEKMRRLYSKGWLIAIGRDPDCFGPDTEPGFGTLASYYSDDDDDDDVGSLHWNHPVFEEFHNTLRIGPSTTVFLERQWAADRAFRGRLPRLKDSDGEGLDS